MGKTRGPVVKLELLRKSREAALNAVQTFNNPLTTFKAETFIVLMVIAWTYLLHAYYRREGVEYRYYERRPKRRKFNRTKTGAYKYWELGKCLGVSACPLDDPTKSNLHFLIGLRNEIEHHQSVGSDERFFREITWRAASTMSAMFVNCLVTSIRLIRRPPLRSNSET